MPITQLNAPTLTAQERSAIEEYVRAQPDGGVTTAALTIAASGGAAAGTTFDGSVAKTIDYSTVGAAKTGAITGSGLTMATGTLLYRKTAATGAIEEQALATLKADLLLTGTNSGDQTSIVGFSNTIAQFNTACSDADFTPASRTISTTAPLGGGGDLTANRTLTISAATTGAAGSMSAEDKSRLDASFTRYHSLLDCSGSHIAGRVAGTYGMAQGDPLAITGTGTLYPLNSIYIAAADYPVAGALNPKLRIRVTLHCNDVAPGHNFVVGLHPLTRPATSGGAGLVIYTIGAAVASSTCTFTTPAADSSNTAVTAADFALPTDGHYAIGAVTNNTTAVSAHVHISAILQMRYA